jgi:hypothetical protein
VNSRALRTGFGKDYMTGRTSLCPMLGKEILLKVVFQAIPTYSMSAFRLLMGLSTEINSFMERFFFGKAYFKSKILS